MSNTITVDAELFQKLKADASRYAYLRDNAKISSCKMDNQHSWRLPSWFKGTGKTFDEAIDKSIAIANEEYQDLLKNYPQFTIH